MTVRGQPQNGRTHSGQFGELIPIVKTIKERSAGRPAVEALKLVLRNALDARLPKQVLTVARSYDQGTSDVVKNEHPVRME
jgi:hypothetical protein